MRGVIRLLGISIWGFFTCASAAETLVLEVNLDPDLLSLVHQVDRLPFEPTMNSSLHVAGNLSDRMNVPTLHNNLVVSALVRIDGEIAGYATEHETVLTGPGGHPYVESAWLITLNHPHGSGFLVVTQRENPAPIFALVPKVKENPNGDWNDEEQQFLATDGVTLVQVATGSVSQYQGGRFEEYDLLTPSDLKKFGRFRGKLKLLVYPNE
jgi:hypothetical protein